MATRLSSTRPGAGPPAGTGTAARISAVSLRGVSRIYSARPGERRGGRAVHALLDVSLHAARGEVLAVVGPSGCGKTTLLELICGLQHPDNGRLRSAPAALMPQHDLLLPWLSALDNAALALRIAHRPRAQARARAAALFAELGLEGFEHARPQELSGGMRQRVAFLRTLLADKPVLCLDEPFGALDAITRAEMQGWLARALEREPRTVVLVTHDVEEAVLLADRVLVMSARPGRMTAEITVQLPRPRGRTEAAVVALRERALLTLGGASGADPRDRGDHASGANTADRDDHASGAIPAGPGDRGDHTGGAA